MTFHLENARMTRRRFVLLDRDGTVIRERHYLSRPSEVELLPGVASGLRYLRKLGLGLVVVTNQSGVARGFFDPEQLDRIHQCLGRLLAAEQIHLDGIYYCPHTPEDNCLCRKPRPQLVELAAAEHGFDPRLSFVVGDKPCDVQLGRNVGATTILVQTGYGRQVAADGLTNPDYLASDVRDAARIIEQLMAENGNQTTNATTRRPSPAHQGSC
jgi:D-glycero-D-manno-heptose 1,7-bisphosphate phosphatase